MQRSGVRIALLIAALCLGAAAAIMTATTPKPRDLKASETVFSAARAMVNDRVIARAPHPQGSVAAHAARDAIFERMAALGLNPRRVSGQAFEAYPRFKGLFAAGGQVENLVGVLPGQDPALQAILVMAHSDSVAGSPGAADDAAGVVSILETVRALQASGPRRRSIIILFTDGEEVGLLGARAFFQSRDPLLKTVGMVVNLEARGGGGRTAMFETGARNGDAMAFFARHVGDTDTLSLMSEVYKYMPNTTDFTVAKRAGFTGFNFAFVGQEFDYHSPSSTAAALDQGSLQHMGDQALAIIRALADAPTLPAAKPDAVYGDVFGRLVLSYSPVVAWVLLTGSGLLALLGARRGARRSGEGLHVGDVLRGFAAALCALFTVALAVHLANRFLDGDLFRQRSLMAQFPLVFAGMSLLAIAAALWVWATAFRGGGRLWLIAAFGVCIIANGLLAGIDLFGLALGCLGALSALGLTRPLTPWSGWLGAFLALFLLTLTLQILAPPLTVATAWPLFLAAPLIFISGSLGRGDGSGAAPLLAAAGFGGMCAADLGHLATPIFTGVGLDAPETLALLAFAAAPALYPLLEGLRVTRAAGISLVMILWALGAGLLFAAAHRTPWTSRRPQPVQVFYLEDAPTASAWRADALPHLDPWSRAALAATGRPIARAPMEPFFDAVFRASAPFVPLDRPLISSSALSVGPGRRVSVIITPRAGGRELRLFLKPSEDLTAFAVNAEPVALRPRAGAWAKLVWAAPTAPLHLTFEGRTGGSVDLRYSEIIDGWPKGQAEPVKAAATMAWGLSDTTMLIDETRVRW